MGDFCFIDKVEEIKKDDHLTAFFTLKGSEEFLKDHFDGFPVMPGVLLLESLKQAALHLLSAGADGLLYRLARVDSAKFGQFVKPGSLLKLQVRIVRKEQNLTHFEGRIDLINEKSAPTKALLADFSLRDAD